ncbi:MAG: hypothetical protein U9N56_09345 [Actinomycetota bacterium]|nr:hypothetical protein [Actinomycetota bacterium]
MAGLDLDDRLGVWEEAGLITGDEAQRIRVYETEAHEHELPGWVEPVAYLGAALVAVALFLFGVQVWDRIAIWGQVGLAVVVTIVLLGTGIALRRSGAAPAQRAASFAWFLSIAGVATTTALVLFDALEVDPDSAIVMTATVSLTAAVGLYLLARTSLQQIGMAVATVFLISTLPAVLPLAEVWMISIVFLAVGVIWLLFTWADILTPPTSGWVLGALFMIMVGFGSFEGAALWSGFGIIVGLALVWLSTRVDRRSLLGLGVLALIVWIPTTVTNLFEESIAVPVAILITGVVTLTVVLAAVRIGRHEAPDATEVGRPHGTR